MTRSARLAASVTALALVLASCATGVRAPTRAGRVVGPASALHAAQREYLRDVATLNVDTAQMNRLYNEADQDFSDWVRVCGELAVDEMAFAKALRGYAWPHAAAGAAAALAAVSEQIATQTFAPCAEARSLSEAQGDLAASASAQPQADAVRSALNLPPAG